MDEHYHHVYSDKGEGFLLGILLLAIVLFLLFYSVGTGGFGTNNTPRVQVPDKINANFNQK